MWMHGSGSKNPLNELNTAHVGGVGPSLALALLRKTFHICDVTNFTFFSFPIESLRVFDVGTRGTELGFGYA